MILNFLTGLFEQGKANRLLNVYRSAISSGHVRLDECPLGQHVLVRWLLRDARLSACSSVQVYLGCVPYPTPFLLLPV